MNLRDKVVLITGGRRLGAHLAVQLADRGAHLAMTWMTDKTSVTEATAACKERGVRAAIYQADLRKLADNQRVVNEVLRDFGRIDVLVNLTSIYTRTPWKSLSPADYDDMLDSNLRAPYYTAVEVAKAMQKQPIENGLQGKMIHFTDWAIDRPYRDFLPYLVGKGGLATLTKALAVELAPTITVNAIAPGTVLPPPDLPEEAREAIKQTSALERLGSPDDVTRAVLYLLEGTDFVTGEIYRVDGGRFLGHPQTNASDF